MADPNEKPEAGNYMPRRGESGSQAESPSYDLCANIAKRKGYLLDEIAGCDRALELLKQHPNLEALFKEVRRAHVFCAL